MIVLGLSPLAHNSAISLLVDGRLVAAAAEERFSRVKNQGGFPHQALRYVLRQAGITAAQVDWVAYAALPFNEERRRDWANYADNLAYVSRAQAPGLRRLCHGANYARNCVRMTELPAWGRSQKQLLSSLAEYGLQDRIAYVDHHRAHCASAYYASGFERALIVSLDGYGSGQAGAFYLGEAGRLSRLCSVPYPHSLGTYYRRVTQALGFKPNQHEGKIVGLAAFGDATRLLDTVRARFDLSHPDYFRIPAGQDPTFERRLAGRYRREDVAAAYQRVLEEVVTEYVGRWLKRTGATHIACA
jgi:carbamoyltransferase